MILNTVDTIVRRSLLERGYPIHYYAEFLFHCTAAVRELSFDTLRIINTVQLPVNSYFAVDLPEDFVDDLGLCLAWGGQLQNIPKNYNINPLRAVNASGDFVPYTDVTVLNQNILGVDPQWLWFWNVNDWGEPTGRFFGAPGGSVQGYSVIPERRQIQLTEGFGAPSIILQYISDGQRSDNATQITPMAIRAIQTYIDWQRGPGATMKDSPEARTFYNERKMLRSRLNPLDKTDILNILRNSFVGSPKS